MILNFFLNPLLPLQRRIAVTFLMLNVVTMMDSSWTLASCTFQQGLEIASFSGPITSMLYKLNQLNDPQLHYVLKYHLFLPNSFKGQVLAGGIYFNTQALQKLSSHAIIFYDQSIELKSEIEKEKLKNKKSWDLREIKTSGIDPLEVTRFSIDQLEPLLTTGCSATLLLMKKKIEAEENEMKQSAAFTIPMVFFLGEIMNQNKLPDLMIGSDMFNLFWLKHQKLQTIATPLHFLPWSQKLLNQQKFLKIGLKDSLSVVDDNQSIAWLDETTVNVSFRGLLIPGVFQWDWMVQFTKKLYPSMVAKMSQHIAKP